MDKKSRYLSPLKGPLIMILEENVMIILFNFIVQKKKHVLLKCLGDF